MRSTVYSFEVKAMDGKKTISLLVLMACWSVSLAQKTVVFKRKDLQNSVGSLGVDSSFACLVAFKMSCFLLVSSLEKLILL